MDRYTIVALVMFLCWAAFAIYFLLKSGWPWYE